MLVTTTCPLVAGDSHAHRRSGRDLPALLRIVPPVLSCARLSLPGRVSAQPRGVEQHGADRRFNAFPDGSTLATWLDPVYRTGLIGKYFNEYVPPYTPPGWAEWMVPKGVFNYTNPKWYINKGLGGSTVDYPGLQTDTMGALAPTSSDATPRVTSRSSSTSTSWLRTTATQPIRMTSVVSRLPTSSRPIATASRAWPTPTRRSTRPT